MVCDCQRVQELAKTYNWNCRLWTRSPAEPEHANGIGGEQPRQAIADCSETDNQDCLSSYSVIGFEATPRSFSCWPNAR
jgi:hypothetical protein